MTSCQVRRCHFRSHEFTSCLYPTTTYPYHSLRELLTSVLPDATFTATGDRLSGALTVLMSLPTTYSHHITSLWRFVKKKRLKYLSTNIHGFKQESITGWRNKKLIFYIDTLSLIIHSNIWNVYNVLQIYRMLDVNFC